MAKKFLDSAGLGVVWSKVKAQDATNLQAAKQYTDDKIAEIPAAIEYKGDGTTITQASGEGTVTFSVGNIDQSKVTGLTDALANKADKTHTHAIANLTDLNEGWDALLQAAPDVATDTDLTALEGRVGTAETKLTGIEAGAQVNVIESILVNGTAVGISGKAATIPVSAEAVSGTITEARVKALAGEVAGSVYRVKGTKATIDEVLEVEATAVGDVYNVTAEFTLNSQKFPAGTNVVFVGPAEEGEPDPTQQAQWDALGGTVDLSPYETTAHATETYATKETVNALDGRVGTLEGQVATKAEQSAVDTLSGKVDANTASIALKLDKSVYDAHIADRTKMHLPVVTESDNGKVLGVVDGNAGWATMSIPLAEGQTTAGIVKAADDSVTITGGTIKVEAMTEEEIGEICV